MNAQRIAGWTALVAGTVFVIGLVVETIAGASSVAGMMGSGTFGNAMTGMGSGMMGMGSGMMGFGNSGPASTPVPGANEMKVQATNFAFTPSEIRLPKGTGVNVAFTNAAGTAVVHDFTVPSLGIHIVANPGETKTVGLSGLAAGRYDAYCSVPGHADLGMRATVIVE